MGRNVRLDSEKVEKLAKEVASKVVNRWTLKDYTVLRDTLLHVKNHLKEPDFYGFETERVLRKFYGYITQGDQGFISGLTTHKHQKRKEHVRMLLVYFPVMAHLAKEMKKRGEDPGEHPYIKRYLLALLYFHLFQQVRREIWEKMPYETLEYRMMVAKRATMEKLKRNPEEFERLKKEFLKLIEDQNIMRKIRRIVAKFSG